MCWQAGNFGSQGTFRCKAVRAGSLLFHKQSKALCLPVSVISMKDFSKDTCERWVLGACKRTGLSKFFTLVLEREQ